MSQQIINTVLLGYGFSGQTFFAPFIKQHEGFNVYGVWERSKKRVQKDFPEAKSFETLEAILADDQVDLVVVNTPIDTHFEFAHKALEAGKNVICEKAFTTTAEEAKTLHLLAKSKGVELFIFQNRRYDSDFRTFKKVLESEKLDPVVEVTISYDFYVPKVRGEVHTEHANSGGEFNNRGSHITDQAVSLFGVPDAVIADFAAFRPNSPVEDYFLATLIYPDKRVKLRATDISLASQPGYIAHGMNGSYIQDRTDVQEDLLLDGATPSREDWTNSKNHKKGFLTYLDNGEKNVEEIPSSIGNYFDYYDAVYDTLTKKIPAPVTGYDGYKNMVVMDAIRESAEKGTRIEIQFDDFEA